MGYMTVNAKLRKALELRGCRAIGKSPNGKYDMYVADENVNWYIGRQGGLFDGPRSSQLRPLPNIKQQLLDEYNAWARDRVTEQSATGPRRPKHRAESNALQHECAAQALRQQMQADAAIIKAREANNN